MKILIVGQGIAGSVLAFTLLQRGVDVHILDHNLPGAASLPAAGIINPVTGKRFVKSWEFERFFPVARTLYQQISRYLDTQCWYEQSILRLLASAEEGNDWSARCAQPDYQDYLTECRDAGPWQDRLRPGFQYGLISNAARVDFPAVIYGLRKQWQDENRYNRLHLETSELERLQADFDSVVFCEGSQAEANPFFAALTWRLTKGEALIVRFRNGPLPATAPMLKKTLMVVPLPDGNCWVGGSYQWQFQDFGPSAGGRDYLEEHLRLMIREPFEVLNHVAGVRPTVQDRRPLIGMSRQRQGVYLFNGLGTKGALLAPYWAAQLADHLLEGKAIHPDVDIQRCY